jgi:phosphate transport system substrate-binding protein
MTARSARLLRTVCRTALLVALTSCASPPAVVTHQPVNLRVVATDACGPTLEAIGEAYQQAYPWVSVQVVTFNAAVAEARLRSGAADVAVLSWIREPIPPLWSAPVATDAVAIVVHPRLPIRDIELSVLQEIFRGRIGEWEDGTPVRIVSREAGAGTRTVFEVRVMAGHDVALTAVVMPGDQEVIRYVARTPGAIGYISMSWIAPDVQVLSLAGVAPTPETLANYPLAYPLRIATLSEPAGAAREFVQWMLTPEAQRLVSRRFAPP